MITLHALTRRHRTASAAAILLAANLYAPPPIADAATSVTLNRPARRLTLPEQTQPPPATERTIELDPAWLIQGITLSNDGRYAFLVVRDLSPNESVSEPASIPVRHTPLSIQQFDLDTAQTVQTYQLPEPFAFKQLTQQQHPVDPRPHRRPPPAGHPAHAGPQHPATPVTRLPISRLAISPDGTALYAWCLPPHTTLVEQHGLDTEQGNDTFLFRFDTHTAAITSERVAADDMPLCWYWLTNPDRMLVHVANADRWAIQIWNPDDLSSTTLMQEATRVRIRLNAEEHDLSKVNLSKLVSPTPRPTVMPDCVGLNDDSTQVLAVFLIPPQTVNLQSGRLSIEFRLTRFDTGTQKPVGRPARFKSDGNIRPVMLRGEHLLLIDSRTRGPNAVQTYHVWNTTRSRHLAAVTLPSHADPGALTLNDAGTELQSYHHRLNLQTYQWRPAWPHEPYTQHTATTPDGHRRVTVQSPPDNTDQTPPTLTITDIQ